MSEVIKVTAWITASIEKSSSLMMTYDGQRAIRFCFLLSLANHSHRIIEDWSGVVNNLHISQ